MEFLPILLNFVAYLVQFGTSSEKKKNIAGQKGAFDPPNLTKPGFFGV